MQTASYILHNNQAQKHLQFMQFQNIKENSRGREATDRFYRWITFFLFFNAYLKDDLENSPSMDKR